MQSYLMYPGYSNPFMPVKDPSQTTEAPTTEVTSSTAIPSELPTTSCPDKKSASTAPPPQQSLQEQIPYYNEPFQPIFVKFLNPSDPDQPKTKTKSWTQVFSQLPVYEP